MLSNHPNCLGGNGPSASSDLIGDVDGPASATDNAVARFDGTTGKLIQNSTVTIADTTGDIAGATSLTSPAATNLTLGTGSYGTALTVASATGAATFAGAVLHPDGTAAAPSISFSSDTDTGWYRSASNRMSLALGGSGILHFATNGVISNAISGASLTLSDSTGAVTVAAAGTNQNITLTPSGTGVNVSNRPFQALLVDRGFTSSDVTGNAWNFGANAGDFIIGEGGVGNFVKIVKTTGRFLIGTTVDSGALLQVGTDSATAAGGAIWGTKWQVFRQTDNQFTVAQSGQEIVSFYKVGAAMRLELNTGSLGTPQIGLNGDTDTGLLLPGANELKLVTGGVAFLTGDSSQNATFAGNVTAPAGGYFIISGRARLRSPGSGVWLMQNDALNDFARLQFGGETSSFPALKRNNATLEAKLADDSAYTNFAASRYYNGSTNVFWSFGTGSPEGAVSASVGSIYSRTDGGAVTSFYVKESGAGNTGWVAK